MRIFIVCNLQAWIRPNRCLYSHRAIINWVKTTHYSSMWFTPIFCNVAFWHRPDIATSMWTVALSNRDAPHKPILVNYQLFIILYCIVGNQKILNWLELSSTIWPLVLCLFLYFFLLLPIIVCLLLCSQYIVRSGPGSCNHARAPAYYAESIGSTVGFWGFRCNDWKDWALGFCSPSNSKNYALMGMHASNEWVSVIQMFDFCIAAMRAFREQCLHCSIVCCCYFYYYYYCQTDIKPPSQSFQCSNVKYIFMISIYLLITDNFNQNNTEKKKQNIRKKLYEIKLSVYAWMHREKVLCRWEQRQSECVAGYMSMAFYLSSCWRTCVRWRVRSNVITSMIIKICCSDETQKKNTDKQRLLT